VAGRFDLLRTCSGQSPAGPHRLFSCKHARLTRRTTHACITRILRDLARGRLVMLVDDTYAAAWKSVCEGLVSKQSQVTISQPVCRVTVLKDLMDAAARSE
jgi:hypothetical protein